jgi:hypothetical protein
VNLQIHKSDESLHQGGGTLKEHPESQYQSYLLRLWRAGEGKVFRVMLEHVGSHERHGFANLEELCAFLREQTSEVAWSPKATGED